MSLSLDEKFLDHPIGFWQELKSRFDKIDPETSLQRSALLSEVVYFRGLVNFYQSRIKEMLIIVNEVEKKVKYSSQPGN